MWGASGGGCGGQQRRCAPRWDGVLVTSHDRHDRLGGRCDSCAVVVASFGRSGRGGGNPASRDRTRQPPPRARQVMAEPIRLVGGKVPKSLDGLTTKGA
eukprot:jgi/Tetstr1/438685/TSEL_027235.t1